jgi:hypothetical protein
MHLLVPHIDEVKDSLGEAAIQALSLVFNNSNGMPPSTPSTRFRADHPELMDRLDKLAGEGLFLKRDDSHSSYRVSCFALPLIGSPHAIQLLECMSTAYEHLEIYYKEHLREPLSVLELIKFSGSNSELAHEALCYMYDVDGWSAGSSSAFPTDSDSTVIINEQVLNYSSFGNLLARVYEWNYVNPKHTSTSTASDNLQDLESESGPESGYGRAPYGNGGYSVLSGPGVVGYGTGGQPTASSSTNESALSILSSTHTEIEAESDLLGRKKLTIALYRLLTEREDDYAFAIGLFGHWGTGKSSQIKFIESELNKTDVPRIMVAHFNAWQSESSSNLGAMLAQAVVDRLLLDKGFWEKIRLAIQLTLLRQSKTWGAVKGGWRSLHIALSKIGIFLPQLLLLLAIGLIIRWFLVSDLFSSTQSWVATTIATIVAPTVFFASAYHFMRSHLTEWFKHLDLKKSLSIFALPDYSSHRGAVLDIHRTLEDLCSLCLKNNKPEVDSYLLLVVDDLDRCKVDTVKEVLDAVRLVANIKHVVTMVSIDERMAFAAVEKHYEQFGHAGRSPDMVARDYLAKVLQVSITLPEITDDGIASYIDQKIFGDIATDEQAPSASPSEDERARVRRNTMIENDRNNIDQMQLAPDSMQEPSLNGPTSTPLKPRRSPFPKEKELFKVLAQTYNFSNPRLLWRHYMAWKLLKSLCLGDTYVEEDIKIPMQLLFWKEWLNQQAAEDRKLYSEWMGNAKGQENPDEKHGEIYSNVKLKLRPHWRQMPEGLSSAVDAVVLPASPQDIAGTKGHVVK